MTTGNSLQNEYKDTPIGPIPTEWEVVQLGEIAELNLGRTPRRKEVEKYWEDGTIPWVSISDLNNGMVKQTAERVSERAFEEVFRGRIVPEGTLLLSFKLTVGKVGILGMDAVHNEAIVSLFVQASRVDRDFLFFLLQHTDYDAFLDSYVKGKTLSKRKLTVFLIPLPPLPEQRRIAHVLSTIQEAIAAQEDLIAAAREMKRSLMQRLFTYGPGAEPAATRETEIGEIPAHWDVLQLERLIGSGPQNGLYKPATFYGTGTPILRIDAYNAGDTISAQHLKRVRLSPVEVETYALSQGDFVVNRVNGNVNLLGKTALVGRLNEATVFESNMMRFSVKKDQIVNEYLLHFLSGAQIRKQIGRKARIVHQTSINQQDLKSLMISVPPISEQQMIADSIAAADQKIAAEEQRKAALVELFRSMLHQLMTGQVQINVEIRIEDRLERQNA